MAANPILEFNRMQKNMTNKTNAANVISEDANKPFVITVYDLIYEIFGQDNPNENLIRENMRKTIKHSHHIIAISNNTKKDLIKLYGIDPRKISVVHLGIRNKAISFKPINSYSLPEKYLLFVGNRGGYKNFIPLVSSISRFLIQNGIFLVCIGGGPFTKKEQTILKEIQVSEKIILIPYLEDSLLFKMYKNALAFIFPSKYEGFGIPILEAMNYGCPMLLSNVSSLPEIGSDAALYFDPYNPESILENLHNIYSSQELRESLIAKGFARVKLFHWGNTYQNTMQVYEKVLLDATETT